MNVSGRAMRTHRLLAVAIAIAAVLASTGPGLATVLVGTVIESASGKVLINLFGNHEIPRELLFPAVHEVEALDVVRLELVRQQKLRDLPILISRDFSLMGPPHSNHLAFGDACAASYGQTTTPSKYLGACYAISLVGGVTHEDFVATTVALPNLSPGGRIDVKDLAAFRAARSAEIQRFGNLVLHFDPMWSPDGTRLLHTVWDSGRIRLELLEASSGMVTKLEPLEAYMATRPIWSDDSRFIAYASLRTVKVFDTRTEATRAIRSQASPSGEAYAVMLFEGPQLRVALYSWNIGYETYVYDTVRGELQHVASGADRPEWLDHARGQPWPFDRYASLRPVRAPTGRYVAFFTFVGGQRRIEVKALR